MDTGATKTVIGNKTLDKLTGKWTAIQRGQIYVDKSVGNNTETFKFGDDRIVRKQKMIHIPVKIGEKVIKLKTYVFPGLVPFLMGIEALRGLNAKIDINRSNFELMGSIVQWRNNSGGHIVLELEAILNEKLEYPIFNVNHYSNEFQNETSHIKKVHVKFGHAKPYKMQRLLENSFMFANMKKTKLQLLIEKAVESCDICYEEKKQDRKPKNSTIRAVSFNESVAIDLTECWDQHSSEKIVICHMVDEYSRLSTAAIVKDKKPETILNVIMTNWLCLFGTPAKLLHDRRGEFMNIQTLNFMNVMGIKTKATSA